GRTIIVLGKRWKIHEMDDTSRGIESLQANLAFSEAYLADSMGSQAGLNHRCYFNFYINDYLWHLLRFANHDPQNAHKDLLEILAQYGIPNSTFPESLRSPEIPPADAVIFHRKRQFFSLMSHHVCRIEIPNEVCE